MVSSLMRTAIARTAVSAGSVAGPSKAVARFSTCTNRFIADNKNDASPARDHRPRSAVGPGGAAQTSSAQLSKDENLGVEPLSAVGGKTQRDAVSSAMGVLDTLARDAASSEGAAIAPIRTPSTPELGAVHDAGTGPLYTPTTLPPKADPTLEFLTNLLMKDGKKAQAQRFTTRTLSLISTLTNSNPLPLIHDAITRTAPLVKLQSKKQGGKSLQVPVVLTQRQSTRKALTWIIDASKKRPDRELERRLAAEFLAVVEGTSSAIAKKEEQHRMATVNRANAAVRI
ncbi:related to RSM7-mitochondrial ribosomal protein, small subunit [Sporisorium reilianum f. sp. reilianum]|uniref:Related to RSM7-mitochondrial ribosomal protein, small subunit n=1 Tax=Sporisorium reilianum f. sp. reilianum TaxID=72559 RepID=A0A2N8UG20_9BASI|nr:related to RSM7-mitochondrial ribosomal protein, small subunit [Sporisorium reilianum f. sp. reilianum]